MKNKYLMLAVNLLGGATKTANKLEASGATIYTWIKQGGVAKKPAALTLSKLTGIDYKLLMRGQS